MMINLPKIENRKLEGKPYNVRDMKVFLQTEDWRAQWIDHHFAKQVNKMYFEEALQE